MASSVDQDAALLAFLRADTTLAALVTAWYRQDDVPEDAQAPYGVVELQAGADDEEGRTTDGRAVEKTIYLVKVVGQGTTGGNAQTAAARVDALLDPGTSGVAGLTTQADGFRAIYSGRMSRVAYPERDGKTVWQHRGGLYEIWWDRL